QHPGEVARPALSLQHLSQGAGIDPRLERCRVDLVDRRVEDRVDPARLQPSTVRLKGPRIPGEVFGRPELRRVDKDADDHALVLPPGAGHQAVVPGVEGPHRGDEANVLAGLAPGDRLLLHGDRRLDQERFTGRSIRAQGWGRRRYARPGRTRERRLRSPRRVWRTDEQISRRGPDSTRGRPG